MGRKKQAMLPPHMYIQHVKSKGLSGSQKAHEVALVFSEMKIPKAENIQDRLEGT